MKRTPTHHAHAVIQPVVNGLGEYGSLKRLMDTYARMTGERPHRATFQRWLRADPKKRMQPALGIGLAIQAAFEQMQNPPR